MIAWAEFPNGRLLHLKWNLPATETTSAILMQENFISSSSSVKLVSKYFLFIDFSGEIVVHQKFVSTMVDAWVLRGFLTS